MPLRKTKHKSDEITRIAYRFLALPDDEQKIKFSKTFGCVRYLYNRMLDDKSKAYKNFGEKLNLTPCMVQASFLLQMAFRSRFSCFGKCTVESQQCIYKLL